MGLRFSWSKVLVAFLMSATMLIGGPAIGDSKSDSVGLENIGGPPHGSKTRGVPEIEVAGLVAAGTLLVGGLAIAAARRRKNRKA
jgi:LPXTG-motif cell wall-anchored protein